MIDSRSLARGCSMRSNRLVNAPMRCGSWGGSLSIATADAVPPKKETPAPCRSDVSRDFLAPSGVLEIATYVAPTRSKRHNGSRQYNDREPVESDRLPSKTAYLISRNVS